MRILVVDDEKEIREYIANMREWTEMGCEVVGKASNGQEALEMLALTNPDVLLTDIKMPVMDGITLAEKVRKEHPELPIIFLTAYSEFEYAKKAIKLGVSDFITKPFQPEDLINSVRLLRNFVHQRDESVWQDEVFTNLRSQNMSDEAKRQWMANHSIVDRKFILLYVEIDNNHIHFHLNQPFSRLVLKEKIDGLIKESHFSYWTDLSHIGIYFMLFSNDHKLDETASIQIMELARQIMNACSNPDFSISIGVSSRLDSLLKLSEGIKQIGKCMEYRMLLGKKSIIAYDSLEHMSLERSRSHEISRNDLSELLNQGDAQKINDFLRSAYRRMLTDGFSKREVQYFSLHLIDIVESVMEDYNIETMSDKQVDLREQVLSYDILTDLLQFLESHLLLVVSLIRDRRVDYSSQLISETKRMIEKHYMEDLTLQKISEDLHVNYSYLSRIFKKETDRNFRDMLWEYRMEIAKSRLAQTDMRSYEVAYAVGCKDPGHFSELFKKYVGQSPTEYREDIRKRK